jgi:hypothetical protein
MQVRRQMQNNDWNGRHWGMLQRSEVRIDSGTFNEMAQQSPPESPPECRDCARDEEVT